jgi:hypothetical protein
MSRGSDRDRDLRIVGEAAIDFGNTVASVFSAEEEGDEDAVPDPRPAQRPL